MLNTYRLIFNFYFNYKVVLRFICHWVLLTFCEDILFLLEIY